MAQDGRRLGQKEAKAAADENEESCRRRHRRRTIDDTQADGSDQSIHPAWLGIGHAAVVRLIISTQETGTDARWSAMSLEGGCKDISRSAASLHERLVPYDRVAFLLVGALCLASRCS